MASIALGIGALGASIFGGVNAANAATTAAGQQVNAEQQGLQFQRDVFAQQQQNEAPFLSAGQTSIADLMKAFSSGTYGPGSNPTFTPPTLEQAQNYPGYQFTQEQGAKGILEASAATGGAISGGTAKALEQYNQGLATTTYGNVYNQALSTYQTNLARQAQEFSQLLAPAQLGQAAAAGINATGTATAQNVGQLMAGIGNAQAAGTVGSANALGAGVTGGLTSLTDTYLLSQLLKNKIPPATPGGAGSIVQMPPG